MTELETLIAQCETHAIPDKDIDVSDIPELTEQDFANGSFKNWKPVKKAISVRIDLDNLEWLKRGGDGYQKRLNEILRWARNNDCPIA